MSEFLAGLGGKVEERLLHIIHTTGGSIREHADVMLCRASRTIKRSSVVMMLAVVGVGLLIVGWVMLNLALHTFLAERISLPVAHLVVMGLNILVGGILLIVAAKLTLTVEGPPALRRTAMPRTAMPRRWPPAHVPAIEMRRAVLPEPKPQPQLLALPPSDLQSAVGAAFELGMLAAQTIPQLVKALRKPTPLDQ